jgi:hypothetical protein
MIDRHFGYALCPRIMSLAKDVFRFQHQIRGLHIVTVRIVVGCTSET